MNKKKICRGSIIQTSYGKGAIERERERERACRSLFYDLVAVKIDKLTLSEMDQKLRDGSKSRERDKEGVA
jgi:hypothetical protein